MIVVYIISTHYKTFYTGMTNNIIRRWREHTTGGSSYLRRVKPKEVVYVEFHPNYSIARKREAYIKRVGAKKFMVKSGYKWQ